MTTRSGGRKFERPRERARAIRLHRDDNMSARKIAKLLGIPWTTIDYWVNPPSEDEATRHREHNARMHTQHHLYLGTVTCPSCGRPGYAELRWQEHVETGVRSFHWAVQHNPWQKINNPRKVFDLIAFTEWNGEGVVFTSPIREAEFRKLVGAAR